MVHSRRLTGPALVLGLAVLSSSPVFSGDAAPADPAAAPIPPPSGLRAPKAQLVAAAGQVTPVSEPSFTNLALKSDRPVLVFCVADWSTAVREMEGVIADLARAYGDRLRVLKLDVAKSPELRDRYVISGIPYYLLLEHGEIAGAELGILSADELRLWIDRTLDTEPDRD